VAKGLAQMRAAGVVGWGARILGVQAAGVAPIARAFAEDRLDRAGGGDTYADSINCPVPRNWRKAVRAVRESGGAYAAVSDDAIREAVRLTGALAGIFAEPAAAAAVAGVAQARRQGIVGAGDSVVAIVSGNGLKDIAGAMSAVGAPHELPPDLEAVARVVQREDAV
jgi:threonine synthase